MSTPIFFAKRCLIVPTLDGLEYPIIIAIWEHEKSKIDKAKSIKSRSLSLGYERLIFDKMLLYLRSI